MKNIWQMVVVWTLIISMYLHLLKCVFICPPDFFMNKMLYDSQPALEPSEAQGRQNDLKIFHWLL